jgi:hypothetical protein
MSRPKLVLPAAFALLALCTVHGATFSRGPFVQNATTNSIQIIWKTPAPATTFVEYGATEALGLVLTNDAMATNHVVTLTNLEPGTAYYYRAGSVDAGGLLSSEIIPFRTFTGSGPVRFLVVGDSPGESVAGSPNTVNVGAAMARESADLVLHCGDIVYFGITNAQIEFFNSFQAQMKSVPFFLVAGNHDLDWPAELTGLSFQQLFYLPTNSATGTEQFYSFDHGDVHFVGLFNPWFRDYVFTTNTIQYQWLTNDLAASAKPWKIIFLHFPIAASAIHASDNYNGILTPPDHVEMMQLLAPVAQNYGVQMIFGSHDHDYERFAPTNGIHYLVTGGGGRGPLYSMYIQHPASVQFWRFFEFVRVSVTNETMLLETVNTNGVVFDSFTINRAAPAPQIWPATWNTPVVETGPANDGDGNINGQSFDFAGPPILTVNGQFSDLGRVYVNNNGSELYLGFQEAAFYRGNNIFLFIESPRFAGVSTLAGLGNGLVDPDGQGVDGLDFLENLAFANFLPSLGCVLGDEYADGQFRSFSRSNLNLNIGQGIFYLDSTFTDVPGVRLQQYNRSPQTNDMPLSQLGINTEQNADYLELAIPFAALGNLQPGDTIKLGAVIGGTDFNSAAQTRQLDSGFLGASLSGSGMNPVILGAVSVRLATNPDWDGDGLPNDWELAHGLDPNSTDGDNGAPGDPDHDGMSNLQEFLAGTDPRDAASRFQVALQPAGAGGFTLAWSAVIGTRYQIQRSEGSLTNFTDVAGPSLPRQATSAAESYKLPPPGTNAPTATYYRVRVVR